MTTPSSPRPRRKAAKSDKDATPREPKYSRTHAPSDLSPEAWQRALRRQFGRAQDFGLRNLGSEAIFSEFRVTNPQSKSAYRVVVRGHAPGDSRCDCPDYATNMLGTCKHVEFVLAALEAKRGAKAAFVRGPNTPYSELLLRHEGGWKLHFRAGTECPGALEEAARTLFDPASAGRMEDGAIDRVPGFLAKAARLQHEVRGQDDVLDFLARQRDATRRAQALDTQYPRGAADATLMKKLLKVPLYPYQAEGALFAARAGRALIGDEMGLGKTIQAIAAAELLARHAGVAKVLIVCPTSLKYQWQSEIARFSAREARVLAGGRVQRQQDFAQEDFCKITNYEKLQHDLDLITQWAPDLVIVDEAQRVKNWNTIAARALKRIASPYAIVLTGTPLENKLEELISIVQFVDQHRLGPTWKLLHEHQVRDDAGRVTGYRQLDRIGQTLAPILLRRRKAEVLQQLPARTDQNLLVPMTEPQMVMHKENEEVVVKIVQRWRKMKFLSEIDQRRLTCALQNMRMACNSTWLLDQETDHGVKADELLTLLLGLFEQSADAKVVVFSQWVRTHEILIRRLEAQGIGYVSFHGGVPSERRPALVDQFREDPACRVFLATDAGATGLNLQHASTLVNMDLPWNPALLEQRIGRIHRMGQKRPIQIVNFIAKGTIEEGMLSRLAFKRSVAEGILDGGLADVTLEGSRLTSFMKDIAGVTAGMGEAEPMTAGEEAVHAGDAQATSDTSATAGDADATDSGFESGSPGPASTTPAGSAESTDGSEDSREPPAPPRDTASPPQDPWQALVSVGAGLLSALASAHDPQAAPHPWVRRDPDTGQAHLALPLPPPETAARLADALGALAQGLRGMGQR